MRRPQLLGKQAHAQLPHHILGLAQHRRAGGISRQPLSVLDGVAHLTLNLAYLVGQSCILAGRGRRLLQAISQRLKVAPIVGQLCRIGVGDKARRNQGSSLLANFLQSVEQSQRSITPHCLIQLALSLQSGLYLGGNSFHLVFQAVAQPSYKNLKIFAVAQLGQVMAGFAAPLLG